MPSGLDNAEATRLVNAMLGLTAYTASQLPINVRLVTSIPTATTNGSELSGNVRVPFVAASGANPASPSPTAATNGAITNSVSAITFPNLTAGEVVGVELWDSNGTPRRKMYGTLAANKTVAAGDSLVFATSALTASLLTTP